MRAAAWLTFLAMAMLSVESFAQADGEKPQAIVAQAIAAIQRGAFDEGVDRLELLSDGGFVHPDASVARAYAYIERARSRMARPGDLGRAVAALQEARILKRGDAEAESALEKLQAEIARRRAQTGGSPLVQRPTLARAVVGLLPENAWAILAVIGSVLLTSALIVYQSIQRRGAEIAGAVGIVAGLVFGLFGGTLAAAARHYRTSSRPAVVVVPEARLLDEAGRPQSPRGANADAVPEGALVHVREQRSDRSRVEWGTVDGFIQSAQLRLLATRPHRAP